jgi:SPOR domain
MADRHQDRAFPAGGYDRGGDQRGPQRGESDPLAELARLIGQTDPFGNLGRGNPQAQPRTAPRAQHQPPYQPPADEEQAPAASPPPWMHRSNSREIPREAPSQHQEEQHDYAPSSRPPLRYGGQPAAPDQDYQHDEPAFADTEDELDPSRYDDALFGQIPTDAQGFQREPAYSDDPYAYQDDAYEDEEEEQGGRRRGGFVTVAAILALAVVGTGAAFAYRSFVGSVHSGEPPIIRADNSPTKIMPAQPDSAKVPDRLASGDGTEKIVPREEAPVDINANAGGPRVVFPSLNQNANPPTPASVAPGMPQVASVGTGIPNNGTLANNQPRPIKTFSVRGDQSDGASAPTNTAAAPPPPPPPVKPSKTTRAVQSAANANASANAPLSLSPQNAQDSEAAPAAEPRTRVAATNPTQTAPSGAAGDGAGGYLVQVSAQRNEADAQASFKALQTKFPNVLGSQTPVIRRADLGEKGIYYRAMIGPFGTSAEASQFCGNLKNAGGQCIIQKN